MKQLILVMFGLWSASTLVPFFKYGTNNFLGFVMLYAIVFYIRRYEPQFSTSPRKQQIGVIAGYLAGFASIVFLDLLGTKVSMAAEYSCYYIRGNTRLLPMIISVCIFCQSRRWKLQSKFVNKMADNMFGVYLIHMYPSVMDWLFTKIFDIKKIIFSPYLPLIAAGQIVLIFIACTAVEALRHILFALTFDRIAAGWKQKGKQQ